MEIKRRYASIDNYKDLLHKDIVISPEKKAGFEKKGYRVAVIGTEDGPSFYVKFNPESIKSFVENIAKNPDWKGVNLKNIYASRRTVLLFENEPWFMYTKKPVDINHTITLESVVNTLDLYPFLTFRPSFLNELVKSKRLI